MSMNTRGRRLLDLLWQERAPVTKQAYQVGGDASGIVTADIPPGEYARSIDARNARLAEERRRQAERADPPANAVARPDIPEAERKAQAKLLRDKAWDDFAATRKSIVQKKTPEQVASENKDYKTWGQRWGRGFANFMEHLSRQPLSVTPGTYNPVKIQQPENYDYGGAEAYANDMLNSYEAQIDTLGNSLRNFGRAAFKRYLNPATYGDSMDARLARESYENEAHNANAAYAYRDAARTQGMLTGLGDVDDQGLVGTVARRNRGANKVVGNTAAAVLTTGGVGGGARALTGSITRLFGRLANALGSRAANATAWAGPRLSTGTGNLVRTGVTETGNAIAMPANVVAHPIQTARAVAQPFIDTAKAAWGTGKGAVMGIKNFAQNPKAMAQAGFNYAKAHPFRAPWNVVKAPVAAAWNIGKPMGKALFSPGAYSALSYYNAWSDAHNNPAGLVRTVGDVALYNTLNKAHPVLSAPLVVRDIYSVIAGDGSEGE